MSYRIIIADDQPVVRHGTAYLIKDIIPLSNIYQTEDLAGTIDLLKTRTADLLIFDINMPGGESINAINIIRAIQPHIRILVFSAYKEDLYAVRYIKAGANGYLNKNCAESEIKLALMAVIERGRYISENVSHQLMSGISQDTGVDTRSKLKQLSNRETEVAALLVKGLGLLEISNQLNIQMSTASTYKTRLFEKLGISNVAELITLFQINQMAV